MLRIPQGREGDSDQSAIPLKRELFTRRTPQMSMVLQKITSDLAKINRIVMLPLAPQNGQRFQTSYKIAPRFYKTRLHRLKRQIPILFNCPPEGWAIQATGTSHERTDMYGL